jgi:hypothetical protein
VLECKANNKPPEAFQQPKVQGLLGSTLEDVLELAPSLEPAGAVVGTFGPFTLVGGEQGDAQFFTGLTCASSEAVGSCNANASAWVVFNGNELMMTSKALKNGLATSITIPPEGHPGGQQRRALPARAAGGRRRRGAHRGSRLVHQAAHPSAGGLRRRGVRSPAAGRATGSAAR